MPADEIDLPESYKVLIGEARKADKEGSRAQLRSYLKIIEQLGADIEQAVRTARRQARTDDRS